MSEQPVFLDSISKSGIEVKYRSLGYFIVFSVLTMGLYIVWWQYKSWKFINQKDEMDINPIVRALFSIFFLHSLFERIKSYADDKNVSYNFNSMLMFIGFLLVNILGYFENFIGLLSVTSFVFIIPAYNTLLSSYKADDDIQAISDNSFGWKQLLLILIGGLAWVGTIYALVSGDYVGDL
jgi:hypothetical protein